MVRHSSVWRISIAAIMLMTLGACKPAPQESAFFSRGGPEVLLDVSSEVVNLDIANSAKPDELSVWISKDKPTRAELYCIANDPRCKQAEKLLKSQSIATAVIPSADNSVALIYERILARDCNQRFVDNTHDYYNAPHPAFGCSTSANIVQHVSNKREFVNPNLSDTPSAVGGVAAYQRAYAPTTNTPQSYNVDSALSKQ